MQDHSLESVRLSKLLPLVAIAAFILVAPLSAQQPRPVTIDVKHSGAVGDGIADDTADLQKALDGGNRIVVIPAGVYQVAATLRVDSQTTIQADARAVIRLTEQSAREATSFLLSNRDWKAGNHDIIIDGGIWDGNNERNPRGKPEQIPCYSGVALNFKNVTGLTLKNLTVRNPESYGIRACRLDHFLIEKIDFDYSIVRPNQDGVHLNGFCSDGTIRNLQAVSPYATNDDMVALNADDATPTQFVMQQDMEMGPIRNITVEKLRAKSAFTFVRILSHRQLIENVTISDIRGGCRFYAINVDRWRFPAGGGNIRNVLLRDIAVCKMPDSFSTQVAAAQRPLIHIQSAVQNFRIENFRRMPDGGVPAATFILDNEQRNRLRLDGLSLAQQNSLLDLSPTLALDMFSILDDAKEPAANRRLQMNTAGKVTLLTGGFASLKIDSPSLARENEAKAAAPAKPSSVSNESERAETFEANDQWRPIHWKPASIVKDSALDFSKFLDAPAGKHGPVVVRDGKLVFQNTPEKPVRLYGAVVSHGLPYLEKAQCEQFADYLAATGYSVVRLHSYNFVKGVMKDIGATEFSPAALDQLDYLFYCLKQRGIYFTLPLNAWGFFKAGDVKDVPEFRERAFRFESNGLLPISADALTWLKEYSQKLLCHTNPYTSLALKDEPALMSLELTNENSLLAVLSQYPEFVEIYRKKCREHLADKLGREPTAEQVQQELPGYVLSLQESFYETMKAYLRGLGAQQSLTDLNFRDNMAYAIPRSRLDYVDIHAYWALYKNLPATPASGAPAYRQNWANPNSIGWGYYLGPVAARLFGKPYCNSEFNGCYPTPYWVFTGPVEATIAASQGWSMVARCGLTAHPKTFFHEAKLSRIETSPSPLMMLSERIGAMLFAQGNLRPLPIKLPMVLTSDYLQSKLDITGGPKYPTAYSRLAFQYQIGTILFDGSQDLSEYPCLVVPPDMEIPKSLERYTCLRADNTLGDRLKQLLPPASDVASSVQMDMERGVARMLSPQSETFLLPAEAGAAAGKYVQVSGNQSVAVCFAGSLDRRSLAESRRMLALYLTDLKCTGTQIEYEVKPKDSVIVRNSGQLPLLVRQDKVRFQFNLSGRPVPRVWALKYDGSRSVELEPQKMAEGFAFDAQAVTNSETFAAFELAWDH